MTFSKAEFSSPSAIETKRQVDHILRLFVPAKELVSLVLLSTYV